LKPAEALAVVVMFCAAMFVVATTYHDANTRLEVIEAELGIIR
jgi:hypothetical protein